MENGSFQEVSPAKIFPLLVKGLGWTVNAQDYSLNILDSLMKYNPDTQSWKTSEQSLFEGSIKFSGRFPRSGMMRNGKIYALPMSERRIKGKGFGSWLIPTPTANPELPNHGSNSKGPHNLTEVALTNWNPGENWPTPTASMMTIQDMEQAKYSGKDQKRPKYREIFPTPDASYRGARKTDLIQNNSTVIRRKSGQKRGMDLQTYVKMWPTPTARDWKDGRSIGDAPVNGLLGRAVNPSSKTGSLSPMWVEWLMGYPIGWTDLNASEIQLSLK